MYIVSRRNIVRALLSCVFLILGLACEAATPVQPVIVLPGFADAAQAPDQDQEQEQDQQRERILDFDADIKVRQDGGMEVTETIDVMANDDQIRHGLLRDFPTTYSRPDGSRVVVGFDVQSVTRDGVPERYKLERMQNGVRVRIGSADVTLEPGRHRYAIRYSTNRQLGFYPDFDELYWNVTGNGWTFPIEHASARIQLPAATPILRWSVYTGPQGARGKDARVTSQGNGGIAFETTAPLDVREGLTVAAAWKKGVVNPPTQAMVLWYNLRDNLDLAIAVLGFMALSAYYVVLFLKSRRRSAPHIVPLYEPPKGMSAPAVQYLVNKRRNAKALSLAIMELIAIRAMRIDKAKGYPAFRLLEPTAQSRRGLQHDGMLGAMLGKLFRQDKVFSGVSDGDAGTRFSDARQLMENQLSTRLDPLIDRRRPWLKRGFRLWLLFLFACIAASWIVDPQAGRNTSFIAPFLVLPVAAVTYLCIGWRSGTISWGVALFGLLFTAPFLAPALALLFSSSASMPVRVLPGILPALFLPVAMCAYRFAAGYTQEGDKVMDEIAGFRQYLALAEGPRLDALATTDEKLQVYERYLPYAIALGVGSKWAAAFAGLAATVAGMAAIQLMQQLYGGYDLLTQDPVNGMRGVTSDIGKTSSFSSTSISSSSSSPGSSGSWTGSSSDSSSSGSSDSGSSGGGGGGGGGSGW